MISNSGSVTNLSESFEVLRLSVIQSSFGFTNVESVSFIKRDRGTNPASGRVEALNPGPPDYNTSALNYSATLPSNVDHRI